MKSPAIAILWQIWRAQRWGYLLCVIYLFTCVIVAQFLPGMLVRAGFSAAEIPAAGWKLATPSILALVYLAATFSATGSADFQETGYTQFMLTLPVTTRTLVIWPAIWGCLTLTATWLVIALGILRPTQNAAPLFWPIAALAVLLTMLQAITWTPVAQSWLRLTVALIAVLLPTIAIALVHFLEISETVAFSGFATVFPFSLWASFHGVGMARRGDTYDLVVATRLSEWISEWRKPSERPFSSMAQAQAWFEFRLYGRMLPFCVLLVAPGFILMLFIMHRDEVQRVWHMLTALLLMPTIFSLTVGLQIGNITFPFLAIRPISTMQLVASKFRMAFVSAVLGSVIVLCLAPFYLMRQALSDSMTTIVSSLGPLKTTGLIILGIVGPALLAWKFLIGNFWISLPGRPWVMNLVVFTGAALSGIFTFMGLWVWTHPEFHAPLAAAAPWLGFGLLIAKIALACWLVWKLQEREMVAGRLAMWLLFSWCGAVATVTFLVQSQLQPTLTSVDLVFTAIALAIPFNRIAAAPLMLDWNRHR